MSRVITISREFGSGGRELGRKLAEELKIGYYDSEILVQLVERTSFTERYIQEMEDNPPYPIFPITIGKTFLHTNDVNFQQAQTVFKAQSRIIRELADKADCVIVGRCADYVLREYHPYRFFVYADVESKIKRCRERESGLSEEEIVRQLKRIDKSRSKYYAYHTDQQWGDKLNYDLCVNTSNTDIQDFASSFSQFFFNSKQTVAPIE